jgi:hypothetical protein
MLNRKVFAAIAFAVAGIALAAATTGPRSDRSPMPHYQKDAARDRGWFLTPAGVAVVDLKSGGVVAQVRLPDWHWAGAPYGCTPALALGPKGEALVSSDVLPVLWRVDPETLAVSRHDLVLDPDAGKDVGFSALAYSVKQATYVAVACAGGTRWRVDPSLKRAQKVLF